MKSLWSKKEVAGHDSGQQVTREKENLKFWPQTWFGGGLHGVNHACYSVTSRCKLCAGAM